MLALSELWQLTDPNLKVEQDLCFWTLKNRRWEKKTKGVLTKQLEDPREKTAVKLDTQSIDICLLSFALISISDTKIKQG